MKQYNVKLNPYRVNAPSGSMLVFWIVLFAIAYIVRDLLKVSVPDIVFTGICATAFMLLDLETSMAFYLFTFALTVPNFEIRLVYLCVMLCKFILQKKKLNIMMFIAVLTIVALELINITLFSKESLYRMLWDFGDIAMYVLLPLFWLGGKFTSKAYSRGLLCYVIGSLFGGAVLLILSGNAVGWDVLLESEGLRLGSINLSGQTDSAAMVTAYNANQLACMQAISASAVLLLMYKKELPKLIGIVFLALMAIIILFTKSRTGTVLFTLLMALCFLYIIIKRKRIIQGIVVAVAVYFLLALLQSYFPAAMQGLWGRFTEEGDITNGRSDLFVRYMNAWADDPWCFFFGYGTVSFLDVVNIWETSHNILTDILICYGLVGLVAICIQWLILTRYSVKRIPKQHRLLAFTPAALAIVAGLTGQYISTGVPHMRLCFLLLAASSFAVEEKAPDAISGEKL